MQIEAKAIVVGKLPKYAGGMIASRFQTQGGGRPKVITCTAPIELDGTFRLQTWNNAAPAFAPSETIFIITLKLAKYTIRHTVIEPEDGEVIDVTDLFSGAPTP